MFQLLITEAGFVVQFLPAIEEGGVIPGFPVEPVAVAQVGYLLKIHQSAAVILHFIVDIAGEEFLFDQLVLRLADIFDGLLVTGIVGKALHKLAEGVYGMEGLGLVILGRQGFLEKADADLEMGGGHIGMVGKDIGEFLIGQTGIGEFVDGEIGIPLPHQGKGSGGGGPLKVDVAIELSGAGKLAVRVELIGFLQPLLGGGKALPLGTGSGKQQHYDYNQKAVVHANPFHSVVQSR